MLLRPFVRLGNAVDESLDAVELGWNLLAGGVEWLDQTGIVSEQIAAEAGFGIEQGGLNVDEIFDHLKVAVEGKLGALALEIAEPREDGGDKDRDEGQAVVDEALHPEWDAVPDGVVGHASREDHCSDKTAEGKAGCVVFEPQRRGGAEMRQRQIWSVFLFSLRLCDLCGSMKG